MRVTECLSLITRLRKLWSEGNLFIRNFGTMYQITFLHKVEEPIFTFTADRTSTFKPFLTPRMLPVANYPKVRLGTICWEEIFTDRVKWNKTGSTQGFRRDRTVQWKTQNQSEPKKNKKTMRLVYISIVYVQDYVLSVSTGLN